MSVADRFICNERITYVGQLQAISQQNRMKENFTFFSIMVAKKCVGLKNSATQDISSCNTTAS
jgi:hypothetical protein